ncbi:red chlorophyll catabolite reductase [Trifolium repens]|nr:red chlorophyll catabolite reductase [Trifolium repens]
MVVMICGHFQLSPFSILSSSSSSSRLQLSAPRCSIMDDTHKQGRSKFLEFPYVSAPHKNLMLDLVSKVEDRFQSQLLPCSLPPDVQYYKSNSGTSQVSLHITPGNTESPLIKTFYEDTKLDTHRQALGKIPEVQPYVTSSLFIRTVASPTAIFIRIQTEDDGGERIDGIISDHIDPISKEVLGIWLDHCACAEREVGEEDKAYLRKRDGVIRNKTIEVDLGSSFPRLFGPEAAKQILEAIKEYFTI